MEQRTSVATRVRRLSAIAVCVAAGLTGCSGDDRDEDAAIAPAGAAPTTNDDPDFFPTPADGTSDAGATVDAGGPPASDGDAVALPSVIEPIPDTGVPGLDSTDAFCRAWSEFAGTFQAVGLVSAIGDPANAIRLEVIAASTVTGAVAALAANLPSELESERDALLREVAGPFGARATRALAALEAVGVEPEQLREIWLEALVEAGVDDPDFEVDVPSSIESSRLAAAIAAFAADELAIVADPALVTDASIPQTEQYLAGECPDGGILAGNDVIDS